MSRTKNCTGKTSLKLNKTPVQALTFTPPRPADEKKWAQSGYLGTTAQEGADADISLP